MTDKEIAVDIPLGSRIQQATIPRTQFAGMYLPKKMPTADDPRRMLRQAMQEGMKAKGLGDKMKPGDRVCIIVTDRTRPTPNHLILPILVETLNGYGIRDADMTIIVGVGMHAPDNPEAIRQNVGQIVADRVEVMNGEPDNENAMVSVGRTSFGTPVEVHRRFAEADVKIGTGNVTPCMLAGWSAGGKIVLPGVVSRRTIYENHKRFTGILAELGCASLLGVMPPENVVRADIEEAATMSGIDLVINTVLDSERRLVDVYCGDHVSVHRSAIEALQPYVEVSVPEKVDVMVTGVGEVDYEVSLFQGGSRVCGGVDRCLKDGGTLILNNECREGIYEGFEHEEFRDWMRQMPTPAEIRELTEGMKIGGEKSCVLHTFSWLIHEKKCRIMTVTNNMTKEELREIHLEHASHVQEAVDEALSCSESGASVAAMPYGALILPKS